MPTYERSIEFLNDLARLTPDQRKQFEAAVHQMVEDLKANRPFRPSLGVERFHRRGALMRCAGALTDERSSSMGHRTSKAKRISSGWRWVLIESIRSEQQVVGFESDHAVCLRCSWLPPLRCAHSIKLLTYFPLLVLFRIVTWLTGHRDVTGVERVNPPPMAPLTRLPGEALFLQVRF